MYYGHIMPVMMAPAADGQYGPLTSLNGLVRNPDFSW